MGHHQPPQDTHALLIDAFLQNNRLDHVTQVMGLHPKYLDVFLRTQNFILRGDGPLPYDYRHYIAIMAAGRHQCSYLVQLQKQEFLMQGGDKTWLKGLAHIPQKLRNLYEINKILAHRPWLLNKSHIKMLTKGTDNWSLSEVVHAIVLLVHFHCLCSFVYGCGVSEEVDASETTDTISSEGYTSDMDTGVGVDTLMQRMKTLSEQQEEFSAEERAKRFERVELQSVELGTSAGLRITPSIGHFVDDPDFIYEDFARRGEDSTIPTFRVQDYSWDDQGYSLVNRLYNDVGNLLDDKFKTAYNLTYYTMGGRRDVDTSRFRRAIWNYIHCMFGIMHDDYNYGEVNHLLERSLKSFIKSTCCFPERTTKADYDRVLREFKHSEKVHVNIMVLEARMQAELLYALRVIMRYMT
ncbi:sestrin homolog [Macrosteles quadrilineatus]|uniref:sestrin homolog n=1 Tax=Macrosteles quadrilineatus TaxID=74068 RepID=UPI0023E0C29C|nr:sestrin homolog [Macrosteles quadrilineatus]XP_054262483.1 sestrin homolog [Macrosteles quadrilineatus]